MEKIDSFSQFTILVTEDEMRGMKRLDQKGVKSGKMDTYMATKIN